jgi:hypothetical protein
MHKRIHRISDLTTKHKKDTKGSDIFIIVFVPFVPFVAFVVQSTFLR